MDKAKLISDIGVHPSDTSITFHAGYGSEYVMEVVNFGVHGDYDACAPCSGDDPLAPRPVEAVMVNVTIRITDKPEEVVDVPAADAG
jgi:hypothetical protein